MTALVHTFPGNPRPRELKATPAQVVQILPKWVSVGDATARAHVGWDLGVSDEKTAHWLSLPSDEDLRRELASYSYRIALDDIGPFLAFNKELRLYPPGF